MLTTALAGVLLGLALIVPLGQQNVFVISQGVSVGMPRALFAAIAAAACDTILIIAGAGGASLLLEQVPGLRPALLAAGVALLVYLGTRSLRASGSGGGLDDGPGAGPRQVLARTAAVSLFNPHAIIDTVGILGAAIAAQPSEARFAFGAGVVTASWFWFVFLVCAAAMLGRLLTPSRRRWFDRLSGVVLLGFAGYLAYEFWHAVG